MARQREFDEDKVLDALQDVFWEHGYEGTSYADIMKATGLQKGSLYAAFGDKRSLYYQAIGRYDQTNVRDGVAMLRDAALPGKDRIALLMQSLVDAAQTQRGRWGCLLCNAAIDQAPFDPKTEEIVSASMNRIKKGIKFALKGTKGETMSELIWTAYFGGRVVIKSRGSKATLRAIKSQTLKLL